MRSRNPCTLWRRRLFGWYVRLLTGISPIGQGRHPAERPDRPMASDGAGRNHLASAGTAHPRPETGAWTCGTRRHRVTDERYAGRLCEVKSAGTHQVGVWKSAGQPSQPRTSAQRFRNLWIASCRRAAPGVMFGARRVSPRSGRPFPAASPSSSVMALHWASDLRRCCSCRSSVNVSAGCFHKDSATFTRCGQTCGTKAPTRAGADSTATGPATAARRTESGTSCGQRLRPRCRLAARDR